MWAGPCGVLGGSGCRPHEPDVTAAQAGQGADLTGDGSWAWPRPAAGCSEPSGFGHLVLLAGLGAGHSGANVGGTSTWVSPPANSGTSGLPVFKARHDCLSILDF